MRDLPGALAELYRLLFDVDAVRVLLADAEATVLAQLSGVTAEGESQWSCAGCT